jgi:hypothetical protein
MRCILIGEVAARLVVRVFWHRQDAKPEWIVEMWNRTRSAALAARQRYFAP